MRTEHDTMGAVQLPKNAYYGAQTQRAVENFPISGRRIPKELIHALGLVKWAAAKANAELGLLSSGRFPLSEKEIDALQTACLEVAEGKFDAEFPIDVYQTGSGTSSNMNANEVIANRANELLGYDFRESARAGGVGVLAVAPGCSTSSADATHPGATLRYTPGSCAETGARIHPNDHVNMGQSTNDIFPTAIHVAMTKLIRRLHDILFHAWETLKEKSEAWKHILKIGRTHLADATPMTLGQEFSGFADQMSRANFWASQALMKMRYDLPVGGTAVGTGINTHPEFGHLVARFLQDEKDYFTEASNHFETNAQRDQLVAAHSLIKSIAVTLFNIANNIRWLGSGPRCGFYEVIIPDLQPGSSIMPGKVNPVLCEALMQACAKVIGNDQTMTLCGATGGQFQLNIMMPVMADVAIESVTLLAGALEVFTEKCLKGLEANEEKCRESVEKSLSMVTALNPYIGYEAAAALAKEAFKTGKTIRELCIEKNVLPPDELEKALDPWSMTKPR